MILSPDGIHETPHDLLAAERQLLETTAGQTVVWSGRAATSLYIAYRTAVESQSDTCKPEVILPAICCATPANVAHYAGCVPRFADVDTRTGLATLESIKSRWNEHTRVVVFVHLFGQTADLAPLSAWCKSKDIVLIEDCAHALGGRLPTGQPVGSVGDCSVYSFNPTKILECGGGALVIGDSDVPSSISGSIRSGTFLPSLDQSARSQLAQSYRNLHLGLVGLLRLNSERGISDLFLGIRGEYDDLLVRALSHSDGIKLSNKWNEISSKLDRRYENAMIYDELLSGVGPWTTIDGWKTSGVCWRYSLLMDFPSRLVDLSEALRKDGFHVSNLYWPLHQFFRPADECPNAVEFARRIVNLWTDSDTSVKTVRTCAASLIKHARASLS